MTSVRGQPAGFQTALLSWSAGHRRDLPWRRTRDPWAVLVSELMLQQTQVNRVIPRYEQFMASWPDPPSCAAAPVRDILVAWSGLGYNRRALYLHRAARVVTEVHGGRLPDHLEGLLALPGVGPYTARAILAFAYEQPVGVLDTNADRVLARSVAGERLGRTEAQTLADRLTPRDRAWAWNQAVLDLGATVCTARRPACDRCPVSSHCRWHRRGRPGPDPAGRRSTQGAFAGSDRQGRGRLIAALAVGPVAASEVTTIMGWPDDPARVERVVEQLVADGLVERSGLEGSLQLPE